MSGAPWWEEFRADQADPPPSTPRPSTPRPQGHRSTGPQPSDVQPSTRVRTGPDRPAVVDGPGAPREVTPAAPATGPVRATRRPPRGERSLKVLAAVLGVVLVALVGVLAVRELAPSGDVAADGSTATGSSAPSAAAPAATSAPSASAATADGTAAADAQARSELEALRESGLAAHPPQGQWVAQLAAKSVGTTDPVQTAANGSSTFYAGDILAQSRGIASGVAGGDVFVLRSTDFGERSVDARGNPYWVTFAAGPFADVDDVRTWCDSVFAATPAQDRANVCLPQQLLAPR